MIPPAPTTANAPATKPAPPGRAASPAAAAAVVLLAILAGLLIFWRLDAGGLHDLDEARHALVAENILRTGDWLTLHHGDAPYFNKAPLGFWLTAATFRVLGPGDGVARLWSALFAAGTAALTGLLARRLYGGRAGLASAFVLLTATQFLYNHCARTGELDSAVLFFWTLTLLLVGDGRRPAFYAGCAAAGLSALAKHLALLPELLAIAGVWLAISGRGRRLGGHAVATGLGITLLVALPWHLVEILRHGSAFWNTYFGREVVFRALHYDAMPRGPDYYLQVIKDGLYPWSLLLPLAALPYLRRGSGGAARPDPLPVIWALAVLAVVTVGRVKLQWYVLPLYPALAMLVGMAATRFAAGAPSRPADAAVALAWAIALLSPAGGWTGNPFAGRALDTMLRVDLLGVAQGAAPPPPAVASALAAVTVLSVLLATRLRPGARRLGGPAGGAAAAVTATGRPAAAARAARGAAVGGLGLLALLLAAAPLRHAGERSELARFAARARGELGPAPTLAVALDDGQAGDDILAWYVRRLGRETAATTWDAAVGRTGHPWTGPVLVSRRLVAAAPVAGAVTLDGTTDLVLLRLPARASPQ